MATYNSIKSTYTIECKTDKSTKQYFINASDYGVPLGQGTFGKVFKGYDAENTKYAIKQIPFINPLSHSRQMEEVNIMINIAGYEGTANLVYAVDSCVTSDMIYIVMPYFNKGSLTNFVESCQIKCEQECIEYMRQIMYGCMLLWRHRIIHRDLKPDNILISTYSDKNYKYDYYLAVSDFGLSKDIYKEKSTMTCKVGTPITRAPEGYTSNYDIEADVYSIGCVLYFMITRKYPFMANNLEELQKIQKTTETLKIMPSFANHHTKLHKLTLQILEGCLQYDRKNRISCDGLTTLFSLATLYSSYNELNLKEEDTNNLINLHKNIRNAPTNPSIIKLEQPPLDSPLVNKYATTFNRNKQYIQNDAPSIVPIAINNEKQNAKWAIVKTNNCMKMLKYIWKLLNYYELDSNVANVAKATLTLRFFNKAKYNTIEIPTEQIHRVVSKIIEELVSFSHAANKYTCNVKSQAQVEYIVCLLSIHYQCSIKIDSLNDLHQALSSHYQQQMPLPSVQYHLECSKEGISAITFL